MNLTQRWTIHTCDGPHGCGAQWAIPAAVNEGYRASGRRFYCSGCRRPWFYNGGKSELQLAHEAQERAERRAKAATSRAEHAERSAAATRGHLTRVKRRVGKGVCPCCNRTCKNLAAHMAGQHPEYADEVAG